MTFTISKRARRHIEKIQTWWRKNRPAAPYLFLDELVAAEVLLRNDPTFGLVYESQRCLLRDGPRRGCDDGLPSRALA